jgi:hypothetical protein
MVNGDDPAPPGLATTGFDVVDEQDVAGTGHNIKTRRCGPVGEASRAVPEAQRRPQAREGGYQPHACREELVDGMII